MVEGLKAVKQFRRERNDAFHFNWLLKIDEGFQRPFDPTHENMASLQLSRAAAPRTGGQPAPRVLRHRRRQRQGQRHPPDRRTRALQIHGDARDAPPLGRRCFPAGAGAKRRSMRLVEAILARDAASAMMART
jgi:hypothetical protein